MLRKFGQTVDSGLGTVHSFSAALAAVLIVAAALLIGVQVVARQLFDRSFLDTLQLGQLAMVFIAYLGVSHNLRTDQHVRATFVFDRLPRLTQVTLEIAANILSIAAVAVLIWQGAAFAFEARALGARLLGGLILPAFPFHVAIPVLFALLELELLRKLAYDVMAFRTITRRPEEHDRTETAC